MYVSGVVVFDAEAGKRIVARYYDKTFFATYEGQVRFEKELISKAVKSSQLLAASGVGSVSDKTHKTTTSVVDNKESSTTNRRSGSQDNISSNFQDNSEVVIVENFIVILRLVNDILLAVIARETENDLLVNEYLTTIHSALSQLTLNNISKKRVYDRLDQVFLVIDESLDNGELFEMDPNNIVARITMQNPESSEGTPTATASNPSNGMPRMTASTAVREGIAAISRGDSDSLRSVFAGAAQSFSNFLGR